MWVHIVQDLGGRKAPPGAPAVAPPSDDSSLAPFVPWALGLLALTTVAAWGGIAINQFSTAPCALQPAGCTEIPIWMKGAAAAALLCCMGVLLSGASSSQLVRTNDTYDRGNLCM